MQPTRKKCETCRFWSEMFAQSLGCCQIEALCLSQFGPKHGNFVRANDSCAEWRDNQFGAIDSSPDCGETARALYQAQDEGML